MTPRARMLCGVVAIASALLLCGCKAKARAQGEAGGIETNGGNVGTRVASAYAEAIGRGEYGPIDSFLAWMDGELTVEKYYRGAGRDRLHEIYSVTKSVTGLVAFIAMSEGRLAPPETPLVKLLPEYADILKGPKASLTLGDALGMGAGLEWDELSLPYTDPSNPVIGLSTSPDPLRFVLERRLVARPGTVFAYNSALSNMIGRLVERAVGETIESFAARTLFEPLGIRDWNWDFDRLGGRANCGWGLRLTSRDMLALGRLILGKGVSAGKRILPETLLAEVLRPRLVVNERGAYGWQFWSKYYPSAGRRSYPLAIGWGGQFIVILPEMNAVLISTASDFHSEREGMMRFLDEFLARWYAG